MDRIVRINVTKNERNVTLNVVNNVIKIIVSQNSSGGGGGGITTLTSSGGTITITGSPTAKNLELSSTLLALINSALQDAPNNVNAYVRSGLSWVIGYTKSAIDTLLSGKANNPTGTPDGTKYLRDDNTWQFLINATPTIKGIAKLYTSLGTGTDGSIDRSTITTEVNAKKKKLPSLGIQSAVSGFTSETVIATILIPANTFASGDFFRVFPYILKNVQSTNRVYKMYHGTTSGATTNQVGTYTATASGTRTVPFWRRFLLDGTTLRNTVISSASILNDIAITSGATSTTTFNPAVDNYFTVTETFQNVLDEAQVLYMNIDESNT